MNSEHITRNKSFDFAIKVVELVRSIQNSEKEYVLSRQLLRSGTAIGAMIREAEHAESRRDFVHKMNIGLKEANESRYWLELLHKTKYIDETSFKESWNWNTELIKLLATIVKSSKLKLNKGE